MLPPVILSVSPTANAPLAISRNRVTIPAARPVVRRTLVAPMLPLPAARTCQMRRVSAFFLGDAQWRERFLGIAREACQIVTGMNAGPEHARRMRIRKEAELFDGDSDGLPRGQRTERAFQFRQPLLWPLPNRFRRDVQVARRAPVDLCGGLEPLQQIFQIRDHFRCEID